VVRGRSLASAIGATSGPDSEDVDHLLIRSSIEEDAPLADAEPPEALRAAKALDVALGKPADRGGNALTVLPTQLAEGLQGSGADLDPPLGPGQPAFSSASASDQEIPALLRASSTARRSSSVSSSSS
jgi:hypothetical protein